MSPLVLKGTRDEVREALGIASVSQDDLDDIAQNDLGPMMRLCQLHDRLEEDNFHVQARNVLLAIKSHHYQLGRKLDALAYGN